MLFYGNIEAILNFRVKSEMPKKRLRKKKKRVDTTEYLLSNEANKAHLLESIKQAKEGKLTKIEIEDLFK